MMVIEWWQVHCKDEVLECPLHEALEYGMASIGLLVLTGEFVKPWSSSFYTAPASRHAKGAHHVQYTVQPVIQRG